LPKESGGFKLPVGARAFEGDVTLEEKKSDCLHCETNNVVRKHIEQHELATCPI